MASITFTTAQELVDIKIQRNNVLIELLETESRILKNGISINFRWVEHNNEKIKLIKKINEVEEQQRQLYCPIRQSEVIMLTNEVNIIDVDIAKQTDSIKTLQEKCTELLKQMQNLNGQIPEQTMVTNYRVRLAGRTEE